MNELMNQLSLIQAAWPTEEMTNTHIHAQKKKEEIR